MSKFRKPVNYADLLDDLVAADPEKFGCSADFFLGETDETLALWDSLPQEERWHLGSGPPPRQAALLNLKKS